MKVVREATICKVVVIIGGLCHNEIGCGPCHELGI